MFGAKDQVKRAENLLRAMSALLAVMGLAMVIIGATTGGIMVLLTAALISAPTFIPRQWRSMNRSSGQASTIE